MNLVVCKPAPLWVTPECRQAARLVACDGHHTREADGSDRMTGADGVEVVPAQFPGEFEGFQEASVVGDTPLD